MTSGTENPGRGPAVPDKPITPPVRPAAGEDVVEPIEETEEYAAAAEDDVALPALGEERPPTGGELSRGRASDVPRKGPE
ncbi:MAG: hypothetical protein FWJ93_10745 [Micromonosporaceae bacterium]